MSQGETGITLTFDVRNTSTPPLPKDNIRINSPADIILHNKTLANLNPTLLSPLPSAFPLPISQGAAQGFTYQIDFGESYPVGLDTLWSEVNYVDVNTLRGKSLEDSVSAGTTAEIEVLAKSNVIITDIRPLDRDTVSQGQTNVPLRMVVQNTGQVAASIDTARLIFLNNHTVTPLTLLGFTIPGGAIDSVDFEVDINSTAALGYDPISGSVDYTNLRSSQSDSYTSGILDSLFIQSFNQGLISLNSVSINPFNVNQGQTGIAATVQVINGGQSSIRVDSLRLTFSPEGLNQSAAVPVLPDTITGGNSQIFTINISVPATAALGLDTVDARLEYTELNSGVGGYIIAGAVNYDSLNIQTPAELEIPLVTIDTLATDTVSAGKTNLTVEFGVINIGEASAQVTAATPLLPNGFATLTRISPATLPTLAGGDTATFVYRGDAGLVTGSYTVDFEVTATDQNEDSSLDTTAVSPATLVIRVPGEIVIDSVVIAQTTVSIGQSNIPATVFLRNGGEMPINVNNLYLLFNGSLTGFAQEPQGTTNFDLNGGEAITREFRLTVLETAPPAVTVDAQATGTELNLQQALLANAIQTDNLIVQGASELRILSVTSAYDSVSRGQSGISALVRIRNSGGTTALIDTLALRFSLGTYSNIDTVFSPARALEADSTLNFQFTNVSVDLASALGVASVNARLAARDSVSNDTLFVENADTTHSWRIVTPGNLEYVVLSPLEVTTNQNVGFTHRVRNLGQANMYLLPTTLLNVGTLNIPITDTTLVLGGQIRDLSFQPTVISLAQGLYDVDMDFDYLENLGSYSDNLDVPDSVQVDSPVSLDTISTSYPRNISQEMILPIDVNLSNAAGSATAILDSVVIPLLSYSLPIADSLAGGANRLDNLQPYIDSSVSGVQNLSVDYYWRDANSGIPQVTSFDLEPITVLIRAQLTDVRYYRSQQCFRWSAKCGSAGSDPEFRGSYSHHRYLVFNPTDWFIYQNSGDNRHGHSGRRHLHFHIFSRCGSQYRHRCR